MLKSQRVAILVDSENLEITVSQHYEPPTKVRRTHLAYPDWIDIVPMVLKGRTLVRNIYYKKKGLRISEKFLRLWVEQLGGEVKQPIKSVDPYIIVDAITLCEKVDTMILLAGDKDYLPLIWYLKSKGCRVEMASFQEAAASVVKSAADGFYVLGEEHTVVLPRSDLKKLEAQTT